MPSNEQLPVFNVVTIIRGPSREELFDALRLFDEKRYVIFVVRLPLIKGPVDLRVRITSLKVVTSGGSCSWNFTACGPKNTRYDGHYETDTRKGEITQITS